jgi:hypothetical protein
LRRFCSFWYFCDYVVIVFKIFHYHRDIVVEVLAIGAVVGVIIIYTVLQFVVVVIAMLLQP